MKKPVWSKHAVFKIEKKEERADPVVPSHFLYLSCPFLSLGGLLPPSPLTFLSPGCILRFPSISFSSRSIFSFSFSLTHLFRSLYRLTSFPPFLRSSLMPFCSFACCAFSRFRTSCYSYNLHINAEFAIRSRPDDTKISLAPCTKPIFFICISFSHCFTMNSYVLQYIYFFFCSSSPQEIQNIGN